MGAENFEYDESKHPRDDRGRWADSGDGSGGGGGGGSATDGSEGQPRAYIGSLHRRLVDEYQRHGLSEEDLDGYRSLAEEIMKEGQKPNMPEDLRESAQGFLEDVEDIDFGRDTGPMTRSEKDRYEQDIEDAVESAEDFMSVAASYLNRKSNPSVFARLDGAEIFATGTWNKLPFTEDDLDSIVRAFDALQLSGRVPLKLGHEGPDARKEPESQFAMGWVKKVWRSGTKLFADMEVPDKVHDLIKQGFLKFVSVELLKDVKASTRNIPWVLDAVALLGADQPAVGVLKDLQSSLAMRRGDFECAARLTFSRVDYVPSTTIGDHSTMSDAQAIQELTDKLMALSNRVAESDAELRTYKARDAEFAQFKARNERLVAELRQRDVEAHRKSIKDTLEKAVKAETILPAARERFVKAYKVDDDGIVMNISIEDVEEFIRDNPNLTRKPEKKKVFAGLKSVDDELPAGISPDEGALLRVNAWLEGKRIDKPTDKDIERAAKAIFKADQQLNGEYVAYAAEQYGHKR